MRFWLAMTSFYKILIDGSFAERVANLSSDEARNATEPATKSETAPKISKPTRTAARSDAISLLATLQREARFVDLVKEQLSDYSDEQVGAAARDVLRDCGEVLDRMFAIEAMDAEEGAELETPEKVDAGRFRLTGNVTGEPPFRGTVVHHGWEATRCDLPTWSGSDGSSRIVAPIELEL